MDRKPEKEVMDDREQVIAYANADFSSSNSLLVEEISKHDLSKPCQVLDLGCGPAYIPVALVKSYPNLSVTAVDASAEMLSHADKHIRSLGLEQQINLVNGAIAGIEKMLKAGQFDIIMSKDLLHHLPDPMVLWEAIKKLSRKGSFVYVMDLIRPGKEEDAAQMVQSVVANEAEILKEDFYNSLLAAFTMEEIKQQLLAAQPQFNVRKIGSRHLLVSGVM